MDAKRCEPPEADRLQRRSSNAVSSEQERRWMRRDVNRLRRTACAVSSGPAALAWTKTSEAAVAEASKSFSHPTSGAGRLQEGP